MVDPNEELIKLAQAGDKRAFDALYASHQNRIVLYCKRLLNNSPESEDAALQVFTTAWVKLDTFRGESPFSNWLMRIATRTCLNWTRGQKEEISSEEILATLTAGAGTSDPDIERAEVQIYAEHVLRQVYRHALTAVPKWTTVVWEIFRLTYREELNASEIAKILKMKPGTVRGLKSTHIRPVLEQVRREMNEEDEKEI